jgi:multiple sugar transport system permease protein
MAIVQDSDVLTTTTASPKRKLSMSQREAAWGLLFLSPWLVGFVLFTAAPMIASFVLSFTDYNQLHPEATHFAGINNYSWLFGDQQTQKSFWVTVKLTVLAVPLTLFAALGVAMLVNNKLLVGKRVFRTLFFMPVQIPIIASVMIWLDFLNGQTGWMRFIMEGGADIVGNILSVVPGMQGAARSLQSYVAPSWFQDTAWATYGLVIMGIWGIGNMMLIFLAGLQSVPTELYEAAKVDGAGAWSQFRNVTLPMISPVFFYNLLLNIIGYAQYFTQAIAVSAGAGVSGGQATAGNPGGETLVWNLNLYNVAWGFNNEMGKGCALAWMMFIVVLGVSVALFRTSARWVFYAGGER